MVNRTKDGGDHSPQGELLDRADRYARLVILGQTMSGSQDSSKGGGKAFGAVEVEVKERRIDAAAKYAAGVINGQLIPSILMLNYGDCDEAPEMRLLNDEEVGLEEAQRDKTLVEAGLAIPAAFLRKKYGLPEPQDGEEVVGGGKGIRDDTVEWDEEGWNGEDESLDAADVEALLRLDDAVFAKELAELMCQGNSDGARKGWDTRGRGRRD